MPHEQLELDGLAKEVRQEDRKAVVVEAPEPSAPSTLPRTEVAVRANTAVAQRPHDPGFVPLTLADTTQYAKIFMASGLFKDVKSLAQAQVKIMMGQELGMAPFTAMKSIDIIEGKAELNPTAMRALIRRDGKYDFEIKTLTNDECEILFFRCLPNGKREFLGPSTFTQEDAKTARLGAASDQYNMYKKYPRNMLISRATSNGVKWFCPDVTLGEIYYQGEIAESRGQAIEAEVVEERSKEVDEAYQKAAFYMSNDNKDAYTTMYYDPEATDRQIIAFCESFMLPTQETP